jgi:putative DNA primase/helicase
LTLATATPPIADAGDGWDCKPDLLPCLDGVVHLPTGEFRAGRPERKLTLATPHPFDPDAPAPRWLRFLDEIMGGDAELVQFLRRALGYSLTGHTREQVFFILFGKGANGKSRFVEAVRYVLGDYAHTTAFSTFEDSRQAAHPEALAELDGRRFVAASETRERSTLDEGRIKSVAHGDTLSARLLYQGRFQFEPQCKLWLATNHKPRVLDDSKGFWRSVRLIPFQQSFDPDAEPTLGDTLKAEAPGILADMVRAAREWYAHGIQAPEIVMAGAEEWRADADPLGEWLAACCVTGPSYYSTARALFGCYCGWAESEGIKERDRLSQTAFGRRMAERFERVRASHTTPTSYCGIGLIYGEKIR